MSISLEDIKNLETLSRLQLSEEGRVALLGEISSIVEYVGNINDLDLGTIDNSTMMHTHKNIVRADQVYTDTGDMRDIILDNAPNREGDYVKVKQVIKK